MTDNATSSALSKVLIVDDDQREAMHARRHLLGASPGAQVEYILRSPDDIGSEAACLDLVDTMPVSAILIDQRLGETSSASYSGLELAGALRDARPMLPIFILTKYAEEDKIEANGFALDDVMSKAMLRENPATYVGRLMRAVRRYEDARSAQSRRMHDLVARSLTADLSDGETDELIRLRADIGIGALGREVERSRETRQNLGRQRDLLALLEDLIEKNKE